MPNSGYILDRLTKTYNKDPEHEHKTQKHLKQ